MVPFSAKGADLSFRIMVLVTVIDKKKNLSNINIKEKIQQKELGVLFV